ncbi:hypothetical protein [Halorubrum sp. PV6]|uniref:hypothetical protein n=1 Tax=Halorubrum sp. PV6 TaxID=634157 RepID=UPI0011989F72|nr:hypothetical protein [Halorubrum sp. PV6]AZQ16041.1 hypothetical protein DOS48_14295 [Halorubrum sp. PV6]
MAELTEREKEILSDALDGVALALLRIGDVDRESLSKFTETKLEKFIYYGLKDQGELPEVTHSWYLAGAKTDDVDDIIGVDQLQASFDRLSGPTNKDQSKFADTQPEIHVSDHIRDYAEFYENDLDIEELRYQRGGQFLLEFYEEEAVGDYKDLYLACQNLRNELTQQKGRLWDIIENRNHGHTLADFGQNADVMGPDRYEEIADLVSELHLEMSKDDDLRELLPQFRQFTDLLEDACLALGKMEVERIDESHLQMINRFNKFFYHQAWKLPALVISSKTATGPRRDDLRVKHLQKLSEKESEYERKLEQLRTAAADATLIPTERDYPSVNSDTESVDEFVRAYLEEENLAKE